MTPIIMLALARLATAEAEEALARGLEEDGEHLLNLHERICQTVEAEHPEPDWQPGEMSHWRRAGEWLAGRDLPGRDVPPPSTSWADLGL